MSETAPLNQPRSKTDLFVSFTLLALQGFGGVLAAGTRKSSGGHCFDTHPCTWNACRAQVEMLRKLRSREIG